jgi:hypothetical protein
MNFNFQVGKKKKGIIEWAKISIVLEGIIEILSSKFKIDKNKLWKLVDEIQKELLKRGLIDDTINDYVINTPELLNQRVESEVDKAIEEYKKIEQPEEKTSIYYEEEKDGSKAQDLLGGAMGIKGAWVDSENK